MSEDRIDMLLEYIAALCWAGGLAYGLGLVGTARRLTSLAEVAKGLLLRECKRW